MSLVIRDYQGASVGAVERRLRKTLAYRRVLDPRAQLFILVTVNLTATTPTSEATDIVGVLSAAAVLLRCGRGKAALAWLAGFALVWVVGWLCALSGDPVLSSVGAMLTMMRKMYVVAMLAVNLVATVRTGELAYALQRLHAPRLAVVALSVALRFFPTLAVEAAAVADAMKLRGIRLSFANVVRHPLAMAEHFAVPLILRASTVADEIARAATVRGIDATTDRTSIYDSRLGLDGWVFLLWFVCLAVFIVATAGDELTFMGLF